MIEDSANVPSESRCQFNQEFEEHQCPLPLLDRDLTENEVLACEDACRKYVDSDTFEIELNNLNEINEYFRVFKDLVKERELRIIHLETYINSIHA
jgi:hypothetical protein